VTRIATLNLWVRNGDWSARSAVLRDGLRELRPDVIGFQEVINDDEHDTASEIVGSDYDVRHQTAGLLGDGNCAAIASRWPVPAGTSSISSSRRAPPTSRPPP
jgi:hypothetical protein